MNFQRCLALTEYKSADVDTILGTFEGIAGETEWRFVFRLRDGRFVFMSGFPLEYGTAWTYDTMSGLQRGIMELDDHHIYRSLLRQMREAYAE